MILPAASGPSDALLARVLELFHLPALAGALLRQLVPIEVDVEAAAAHRDEDPHGRGGVLAWDRACDALSPETSLVSRSALELAACGLADWGLLQIVGQTPGDLAIPGSAAMRLTYAGRVALGLAPARRTSERVGTLGGWEILHGASREALLLEAWRGIEAEGRGAADLPVHLSPRLEIADAIQQVALRLLGEGAVVVDAFALCEPDVCAAAPPLLEGLLVRSALACAPRVLVLPDPIFVRVAARLAGARLQWVESQVETRRRGVVIDRRFRDTLRAARAGTAAVADLTGVPDSDLATPQRVQTAWADLLLPHTVQREFEQALMHARFRLGPGAGTLGYKLLLSGLPGTGKSMAAEALATTLDRPLVKLDLSSVLSKWLGETEKLLAQVFDVAEASGAVLVLDEAESLLRQRESGATGAHAMATGVAYLLTRLDRFRGVLVATTNRTRDLDEAFFRRFDDFIVLPIPDEPTRALLWRRHLALPDAHAVDLDLLARRFAISGGLIRGASVRARAWADGMGQPLDTALALASLGRELEKSDRSSAEVFIGEHAEQVRLLLRGASAQDPPSPRRPRARVFGSST